MIRPSVPPGRAVTLAVGIVGALFSGISVAGQVTVETTITAVAVNGGGDVANPGTACVHIADPVSASCPGGFVAIPNSNKLLIATALMSKSTASRVWFYYIDDGSSQHCPGLVFTPCSVISIMSK